VGGSVAGALLLPGVQASRVPPEVEVVRIRDAPGCPGSGELPTPGNISSTRTAILCLLNRARAEHGLAPLTRNSSLELASQRHSEDMARRDFYEHDTPEGLAPISRMASAGYPTGTASVGENIHWGRDVNATPVRDDLLVEPHAGQTVVDLAYRNDGRPTALVAAARAAGCEVVDGYEALVRQGAASFTLWTALPAPVEAMRSALGLAS